MEIRLAIVEDDDLFRDLMQNALARVPRLRMVGAFASGGEALQELSGVRPDVILLDIDLGPGPNGLSVGLTVRKTLPKVGIVLFSKNPMTTLAAIDRVVHHSVVIDLMGLESYRARQAAAKRDAEEVEEEE